MAVGGGAMRGRASANIESSKLHQRDYYRSESFRAAASEKKDHRRFDDAVNDEKSHLNRFLNTDKRMGSCKPFFYSLAMEPFEVRRGRVIMLTEAYAIFGALFLEGTSIVRDYGSSKEFENPILEQIFELSSTICVICNLYLAMFAGFYWILSILYSGTHPNWVYGSANGFVGLHWFLVAILFFTTVTVGIGIYNNLQAYKVEAFVLLGVLVTIVLDALYRISHVMADLIPLEYYHFPAWFRLAILPFPLLTKRDEIKSNAKARADLLKTHAVREKTEKPVQFHDHDTAELERLLQKAAAKISLPDLDIIPYILMLEEQLYFDVESLVDETLDELISLGIPRRLAKSLHSLITNK